MKRMVLTSISSIKSPMTKPQTVFMVAWKVSWLRGLDDTNFPIRSRFEKCFAFSIFGSRTSLFQDRAFAFEVRFSISIG